MSLLRRLAGRRAPGPPWSDAAPVREELFGVERLEQHARTLADAQAVTARPRRVLPLHDRLDDNATVLLSAYRSAAAELESGRTPLPAAEWLLDNYYVVEGQVRDVRDHLPAGFYRQLPKLAGGPFAGYPRVFGIAWAFVAHADSHFDPEHLRRFIEAYQTVEPLTIGELWAVAITLRIVLVENLRRLADQITIAHAQRFEAEAFADRLLDPSTARESLQSADAHDPLPEIFAAQLAKRLRDQDPVTTPALGWLVDRLASQRSSVEAIVEEAQQRQAVSNVSVRNVITSMRTIAEFGWSDFVEGVSLVDRTLRDGSAFGTLDFPTRNFYRSAVEELARHSRASELEIAARVVETARTARVAVEDPLEAERLGDPGYHLVGDGRPAFEAAAGFVAPLALRVRRAAIRLGMGGYVGACVAGTTLLALVAWSTLRASTAADAAGLVALVVLFAVAPLSDVAIALVNRLVTFAVRPRPLPAVELADGIPVPLRTLVVVPTLLTDADGIRAQCELLEVHYLSGTGGEVYFALLTDWIDADAEGLPDDAALLAQAESAIEGLNRRHAAGPAGDRFLLLHRRRQFNAGERRWIGWERKRGKLHELDRLLRGARDTSYLPRGDGRPQVPDGVRYVVTLDADTRMPRETVRRLVGKMAHPLNRPRIDATTRRVVAGYGIMQPRVTPALPLGDEGSLYRGIYAGPSGIDPYAAAASDTYQDLLGEGTFTGKGIYDVDAFETVMAGRVPENALLSHDLFESAFARAALVSDVEVIEDFPSRYDLDARRHHRWMRGDWQLLPWIAGVSPGARGVPAVGRWKMLDNLRRSLVAPSTFAAVVAAWSLGPHAALLAAWLLLAAIAVPPFLPVLHTALFPDRRVTWRRHLGASLRELRQAALQTTLAIVFLADRAWRGADAIVRTLARVFVTRRRLLEWTASAQAARGARPGLAGTYREMAGGTILAGLVTATAFALMPTNGTPLVSFLAVAWLVAPVVAFRVSRPTRGPTAAPPSIDEARRLRLVARSTWRYFETFVTPVDNWLPPDNFQEDPQPVVAHRTSPTNIGLYLVASVAARDFGWAGTGATAERLEQTLDAVDRLARHRGHLFNWYATDDLRVLEPAYVSSVDSGNLAGHLIVVANACESWCGAPLAPRADEGLRDTLALAREAARDAGAIARLERLSLELATVDGQRAVLARLADECGTASPAEGEPAAWLAALARTLAEHERDRGLRPDDVAALDARLRSIAARARALATGMDFAFLVDAERELLSIGWSRPDNRLDPACYDLLASEARLASLFAIAKGDVETKHWFRLGRTATPIGGGSALLSWSGSMFEYLMPSLVMRAPAGSLLEETSRRVVDRQREYAGERGVPWGISEAAYNARDLHFTYQYRNFGVPGLGLKRGLADDLVIAPYATGLAAMVDPARALENYDAIARDGGRGRYGFHDALDYTRTRLPESGRVAVVRNYMAHHQGMTVVAIANALHDGAMRARFHAEPMIAASELLLQERTPRLVAEAEPLAAEVRGSGSAVDEGGTSLRRVVPARAAAPVTHLLSNGHYAVLLTASGAGCSRWGDIAVTRWREDPTRDADGSFIYLRDLRRGTTWSATMQPLMKAFDEADGTASATFDEDHASFGRRDGSLRTTLDVVVSGEDDAEVRRVTLTNSGRRVREIELTSYAELVLAPAAGDHAHPAFSKMFVQTSFRPDFEALLATRRPRSPSDPSVRAAHFVVVEGADAQMAGYETDRARFLGRGRDARDPAALDEGSVLSRSVGTVLDPVFSLRHRVRVPPGGAVRLSYWTVVAASEEALADLVERHRDRNAFDRAKTFAWTRAQVHLRHLGVGPEEAADFQRLAAPVVYADPRFRAGPAAIVRGMGPQSGLWSQSISGDLPIVLLRIDDVDDMAQVRQLLRAHEYWRAKGLAADLVVLNERASSYTQDLQNAIDSAVRSSQARTTLGTRGAVHALRADLVGAETLALLHAVARVHLVARRGSIGSQLARAFRDARTAGDPVASPPRRPVETSGARTRSDGLEFFNGTGGFDRDGREYVVLLGGRRPTPAPWINVVANPHFGFHVSADGSGFTWAENSRDNQLTPWSNDPVTDPSGEVLYVRDETSGRVFAPTAQPFFDGDPRVARHGFGYSRFTGTSDGIGLDLVQFVPPDEAVKVSRLVLVNRSNVARSLSVTAYVEWVLGTSRTAPSPFVASVVDEATGALFVRNPWATNFPGRVSFVDLRGAQTGWTCDRTEFLGRHGSTASPEALLRGATLSKRTGAGFDACSALQTAVRLAPGARREVVVLLGQAGDEAGARAALARLRGLDLDAALGAVGERWDALLGAVRVRTPDRATDILLNGWLLYQTIACRAWARTAFYQASGAYGFRDQLQDGLALLYAMPAQTRRHLLAAASRQFVEGDVQHWWLPHSGQGVRTAISDDRVWLAYGVATYVAVTGDAAILDEPVRWLDGPRLQPGEHDAFFAPSVVDDASPLFEHCARGLDQCLALRGARGLPLMGTGDWNDGMNRVGQEGRGESVWLAWLLVRTLSAFAPHADGRDPARATRWRAEAETVRAAIEREAWDGAWYRRASFDDGTWLGSVDSEECRIDSIAQSWSVLSHAGDPERARAAMDAVGDRLVDRQRKLALLFTPPFDRTTHDPGYVKGYPPGLRENGGQYTHAAAWAVLAFAELGDADRAADLFALLNPINHALTHSEVNTYKVEPYVIAADVYSVGRNAGRGGWTWYTGSAGWMYRAGIEGLLGLTREADTLVLRPTLPARWPRVSIDVDFDGTRYSIVVERTDVTATEARLDDSPLALRHDRLRLPLDRGIHRVAVLLPKTAASIDR